MPTGKLAVLAALALVLASTSAVPGLADPPGGDTCDTAIVIDWGGTWTFLGDLTPCANDYDPGVPGPSCTGSAAPGRDLVLALDVACGQFVDLYFHPSGFDGSIYVVTDCADLSGSCIAGADGTGLGGTEYLGLWSSSTRTYYIIVDAHDVATGGAFNITFGYGFWDIPPGACCFPDGHCAVMLVDYCVPAGGDFQGLCSICDPNPCSPTPALEKTWGAIKARFK